MKKYLLAILFIPLVAYSEEYVDGHLFNNLELSQWTAMSAPSVSPSSTARVYYDLASNTLKLSQNGGAYSDILTYTSGDLAYLKLDGSNANTTVNIGSQALTTTGLGTFGSLVVDTNTLVVNASGYSDKVGIGTASPSYPLHVVGNQYLQSGNMGIGATPYTYGAAGSEHILEMYRTFTDYTASAEKVGTFNQMFYNPQGSGTVVQYVAGSATNVSLLNTATVGISGTGYLQGIQNAVFNRSDVSVSNIYGNRVMVGTYNGASDSTGTVTNLYGQYIVGFKTASSTITNAYGVYITGMQGTNVYDVYAADSAAKNYFAGKVGIGTTSPEEKLHVAGNILLGDNNKTLFGTGKDASIYYDGTNLIVNPREVGSGFMRYSSAINRRYYHLPVDAFDPGASGATFIPPSANTVGGYQIDAATEFLYFESDVHSDWDGASDLKVEVVFEVNVDNTGGGAGDTVDLRLQGFAKGNAETACKTLSITEVSTTVGASAQYKQFKATFTIDYDAVGAVVEAGDKIGFILNIETDTSEVDNIIVSDGSFYYNTSHVSIESGDV